MWLLKLAVVFVCMITATCQSDCTWPWFWFFGTNCTHECGGGMQNCYGTNGYVMNRTCNEFCFNGGSFYNGSCHCNTWRTGRCCEECQQIHISYCKQGKTECGGSPDNIRCTECIPPYISAGWGLGCRRSCTEGNGGCDHICLEESGITKCKCRQGYALLQDGYSCEDIDECTESISKCSQVCVNEPGNYTCGCRDGDSLQNDGFSCKGNEQPESVFHRYGLVRNLLPRGCSTILLSRCTEEKTIDVFMSSTSPWYQSRADSSVIYTFGIVFVEVNMLSLPVSITGLQIVKQNDDFAIVTGSLAYDETVDVRYGEERQVDCLSFTTTPRDIHEFLSSSSFMKSFYDRLNMILPDWLSFSQEGTEILGVNDVHADLLTGQEIQNGKCSGAPLYDQRLYIVLRVGSSFSLSLYEEQVTLPGALTNQQFCFIIDICQDYGGSIFLTIPENSRDILYKFNLFKSFKDKYGIGFRPLGLGLSLFKHIYVPSSGTALQLWNGDDYFRYRVMQEANMWLSGSAEMAYSGDIFSVSVEASSNAYNMFVSIPSPQDILKSMFFDEWNVLFKLNLLGSINIRFPLFDQYHTLSLKRSLTSEIDAYASLGGQNERVWCGENSNPPGIFLSLMVDINPFREIPILKNGLFDFNNMVYAYLATDPTVAMTSNYEFDLVHDLSNVKESVEIFINTTVANVFRYITLFNSQSAKMLNKLQITASKFLTSVETFITELSHGQSNSIQHLIDTISVIWVNGWSTLENDTKQFLDSIEHITAIAKYNFTKLHVLTQEVDLLKRNIQGVRDKLVRQMFDIIPGFQGFGLRYKGNLKIFFLNIVGLEIEFVYSTDQLGACSRFKEVFSLLKGERAARVYAVVSSGLYKIAPFLRMNVGAGIGLALSIDTPGRKVVQLHAEASVLGIYGRVDVFLTERGHYFFMEGNVWNTFKTVLRVSFEDNTNSGAVDTFGVKGTFLANAGEGSSFQDSYLDGLRKLIRKLADEANERITRVQNSLTSAQKALTGAQNWLEEKKADVLNANTAFDRAVQSLEHAKQKLEDAKIPFRYAMSKLNEAQRKVNNLCRIRSCRRICIPGIRCQIRWTRFWFFWIPYPYCYFTWCMFWFPDPFCVLFNIGCRIVRALAYLALEVAKFFVRIPMLALDAAKALVSGAQFVVDKSRVVLDIAVGALSLAQLGLEGAKYILEGAKIALEAVKKVVEWGLKALDFIIQYGIQTLIDVRNCGFELKAALHDTLVFRVMCEINLFRQGFRTVEIGINFGNPIQSIWQAAKGTVDTFIDVSEQVRNKREVKSKILSGLHQVIRKARNADTENEDFDAFLNDTLDTVFRTSGFKQNASSGDYENRVEIFEEKCSVFQNAFGFYSEALQVLHEMSNETANTLYNASSVEDELTDVNVSGIVSNFTAETIGINTDAAFEDFNISTGDIDEAMENAKGNLSNDPLLSGIDDLSKSAKTFLQNQTNEASKIKILDQWIIVMENITSEYFTDDKCISFLDCAHFAVFQLYGLFDAESITNMTESLDAISSFEDLFLELTSNSSHTVLEIHELGNSLSETLSTINELNVFCSEPPQLLSPMISQRVRKGEALHLVCNVTGNPPPIIWWFRNDEYLPEHEYMELVIQNVSEADAEKYHCVAGNVVANLTSDYAEVFVLDLEETKGAEKDETSTTLELSIIVGSTVAAITVMIIVVIGGIAAWRTYLRKKTRKSKRLGSIVSLNMIRPDVQKPVFKPNTVTEMNSEYF